MPNTASEAGFLSYAESPRCSRPMSFDATRERARGFGSGEESTDRCAATPGILRVDQGNPRTPQPSWKLVKIFRTVGQRPALADKKIVAQVLSIHPSDRCDRDGYGPDPARQPIG